MKTLYKKDSVGKTRVLEINVVGSTITTKHGILNGSMVTKTKTIKEGKNIGKSNETSTGEQAILEATSTWQKKRDKGYFTSIKDTKNIIVYLPMLAHSFLKRMHNILYPAYVQAKLDGVRCLVKKISETEIHFMSRGGKSYDALQRHTVLKEVLLKIMKVGQIYDGEIYVHGWSLQKIISSVKKFKHSTLMLQYWIYDIVTDETFEDRFVNVKKSKKLKFLKTYAITKKEDVYKWHDKFVQEGFEGVIIRNSAGLYKLGSRSADLQKYKEFFEDEFEIVGYEVENQNYTSGCHECGSVSETKDYKCIVYVCKTKEGNTFTCRPRGSYESRQELLKVADTLIGKDLTVRYQALTDNKEGNGKGVPQFGVGICIRDYE